MKTNIPCQCCAVDWYEKTVNANWHDYNKVCNACRTFLNKISKSVVPFEPFHTDLEREELSSLRRKLIVINEKIYMMDMRYRFCKDKPLGWFKKQGSKYDIVKARIDIVNSYAYDRYINDPSVELAGIEVLSFLIKRIQKRETIWKLLYSK